MNRPEILFYCKLERINTGIASLRFDCTSFVGYYPPFEQIRNRKGDLYLYLLKSRNNTSSTPENYLQTKDGVNLTGLFHDWNNGKLSGFCSGYPCNKKTLAIKKVLNNPFYPEYINDGFLFIIDFNKETNTPISIEIIVLKAAKHLIEAYRNQLAKGGFNEELEQLRKQTKTNLFDF